MDLRGSTNQKSVEFQLPEQALTDSVPSGIPSGSEKQATEFYPWVPEGNCILYDQNTSINLKVYSYVLMLI